MKPQHVLLVWSVILLVACAPEVEEGVSLRGEVSLDDQGEPVGVQVHLNLAGGDLVESTATDDRGSFAFSSVSQVSYELTFIREGYQTLTVPAIWNGSAHIINDEKPVALSSLRTATLSGQLVSPRIKPERGGDWGKELRSARLLDRQGAQVSAVLVENSGAFSLPQAVIPGEYLLQMDVDGHLPLNRAESDVVLEEGDNDLGELSLVEGVVVLRGRVGLGGAEDAGGVRVDVRVDGELLTTTSTDGEGSFSVPTSRVGHTLSFSRDGFRPSRDIVVVWIDVEEEPAGGHFEVDGEPIEGRVFELVAEPASSLRGEVSSELGDLDDWPTRAIATLVGLEDEGAQRIAPVSNSEGGRGQFQFVALPPGDYQLSISADGHAPFSQRMTLEVGDNTLDEPIVLTPQAGVATLRGRVCRRSCADSDHGGILVRATIGNNLVATGLTDNTGQFAIATTQDTHRLEFSADGFLGESIEAVTFSQQGNFLVGDTPLSEIEVVLSQVPFDGRIEVSLDVAPDWIPTAQRTASVRLIGDGVQETRSGVADGATEIFTGLSRGTYLIIADRPGFFPEQKVVDLSIGRPEAAESLTVTLFDLSQARLDVSGVEVTSDDLEQVNLRGADLGGINLSGQALSGIDMRDANLTGAILTGVDLSNARLERARLTTAEMTGANLTCARADGADFFGADLSDSVLISTGLVNTSFVNALLVGARFTDPEAETPVCDLVPDPPVDDLPLGGATFRGADMSDAQMLGFDTRGADLSNAVMTRADLTGADLRGVDLTLARLTQTVLQDANLEEAVLLNAFLLQTQLQNATLDRALLISAIIELADFSGASLLGSNFNGANIAGVNLADVAAQGASFLAVTLGDAQQGQVRTSLIGGRFEGAEMVSVLFNRADLTNAVFTGADMRSSTFLDTIFTGAAFISTDLAQVNLADADLAEVDFSGARLNSAILIGARMEDAVFSRNELSADLTGADLTNATLSRSIMVNVDLSQATLKGVQALDVNFQGARLFQADLQFADFRASNFTNAEMTDVLMTGVDLGSARVVRDGRRVTVAVDLSGAQLVRADLRGADMSNRGGTFAPLLNNANLLGANLAGALLDGVTMNGGQLGGADLTGASITNANFGGVQARTLSARGVILTGSNFVGCDLSGGLFIGATIINATFETTDLTASNFTNAVVERTLFRGDMQRTRFFNADMTGVTTNIFEFCWEGVEFNANTICPDGSFHPNSTVCNILLNVECN